LEINIKVKDNLNVRDLNGKVKEKRVIWWSLVDKCAVRVQHNIL
jgi:hypothetical protein